MLIFSIWTDHGAFCSCVMGSQGPHKIWGFPDEKEECRRWGAEHGLNLQVPFCSVCGGPVCAHQLAGFTDHVTHIIGDNDRDTQNRYMAQNIAEKRQWEEIILLIHVQCDPRNAEMIPTQLVGLSVRGEVKTMINYSDLTGVTKKKQTEMIYRSHESTELHPLSLMLNVS